MAHTDDYYRDAVELTGQWPDYSNSFPDMSEWWARIMTPFALGHAFIERDDEGRRLLVIWSKPTTQMSFPPSTEDWSKDGPYLWVMELVWDKGMTARAATRLYLEGFVRRGIAQEGDVVLFWRQSSRRIGWGKLRLRGPDGIRKQDDHEREQPVGKHAEVAGGRL